MSKVILVDSREKPHAIGKILRQFEENEYTYYTNCLPVGDYAFVNDLSIIVDRKQNLTELCGNVCQQHARFKAEILRANEMGIKLIFLVEHGNDIKCLEDIKQWENPRCKHSPKATTGIQLHKILTTIENRYDVKFEFCSKEDCGKKIIELLKGELI